MTERDIILSQTIFQVVNQLGALIATPGISEEVKDAANEQIKKLLSQLDPVISKMSLASSGILTN
jgi:hypothetical protein